MNGPAVAGDEPETSAADQLLAAWAAEIVDRIGAGENVDLDAIALEYPAGVERVRRLIPGMAMMARLRTSAGPVAENQPSNGLPLTSALLCGDLGDFRALREIGRGGMGVVYDAIQVSLNRRVALKILPIARCRRSSKSQTVPRGGPRGGLPASPAYRPGLSGRVRGCCPLLRDAAHRRADPGRGHRGGSAEPRASEGRSRRP